MRVNVGQEFVIGGYTRAPRAFDAPVFGYYQDGQLLYVARTRNGFTPASRDELFKRFKGLETSQCPSANLPETRNGLWGQGLTAEKMADCVWLRPVLVGQFEFLECTPDDHLCDSRFVALREDKQPKNVLRCEAHSDTGTSNAMVCCGIIGTIYRTGKENRMSQQPLAAEFDQEMHRIYQRALLEAHYKASKFLQMLHEHGGLVTAQILLHSAKVSDGYTALWERGRLDLMVEAIIQDNAKWHPLFTRDELAICAQPLSDYGYKHN